ncbi:hypothetical protein LSH36_40g07035 [Paralvinella palmiformis]|uniref:C2H2-type domain-containing protein n=1 Tax=Paralvinella palmiformis TaxID=53620 RepID=A0AAD9K7Q4_9ANNE|nr:hypothetical protein LSH36_40g07035 [Paralvinella palmiformis]
MAFVEHVANKKVPTDGALTALASTLSLFCKLRPQIPADINWDQLGHVIFIEAARVVLGLDFQKLDDSDPLSPKAIFKKALNKAYVDLQDSPCGQFFLVLQWLVVNGWTHPVLQDMMKGLEIEEEKVQTYLRSGEYPEIFRLRVDMLMENGCDDFALNLATWCTKSPIFQSDPYIRQAQLLLLIKLNRQEEFHNACWQIWQLQCCLSLCILKVILSKGREEDKRPLLTLTQTFLVHDWMKPDKYCCTEPLLKFWLSLEREQEPNADVFIQSVSKMEQLASNARQLQILIKALSLQFPGEFLQFSLECMLSAIRMDRNKLDTARIYVKDDKEADQAADSLARSCLVIALMFKDDIRIQLAANMTAFYLDPTEEMYHKIKKAVLANQLSVKTSSNQHSSGTISDEEEAVPQDPIMAPNEVDGHTFYEVMHAVDTLRPNTFSIYSSWSNLQKHLRASLEEAGYTYNHRKDTFMTLEEKMIRRRRAVEKAQKKKLRDDITKSETSIESLERSSSVEHPSSTCSQSVLSSGCSGVINAPKEAVSIPLLDITLDELQQVLDNSSHSKVASGKETGTSSSLSSSVEQKESTEDIMVNSIKEFLKGGDVGIQGLPPSQPSQHISLCDDTSTTQTGQQHPQQQSTTQLIQQPIEQSTPIYGEQHHVSQALSQHTSGESKSHQISQTASLKPYEKASETSVKNENVALSGEMTQPTVFTCKYCGKAYSSMRQRRRHQEWLCKSKVNAAAGEKALVELVKEKERVRSAFDDSSLLRDDYGNYLCEICRRRCGTVSALRLHQRRAHSGYKGKTNLPSGVSIKECSVKLDRLEDAPVPKVFKKIEQLPEKGKGKEGISKLLSKKYSTGFFLSSLNMKNKIKENEKEVEKSQRLAEAVLNSSVKKFNNGNDPFTGNSIPVDLNAGDAQVELFAPSDDSHPVLCDLCGAVCSCYETMKEHQAVCALSSQMVSPVKDRKESSASTTTKTLFSSSSSAGVGTANDAMMVSPLSLQMAIIQSSSSSISTSQNVSLASQQPNKAAMQTVSQIKQTSVRCNKVKTQASTMLLQVADKERTKQNQLKNKPNRNLSPPPKPRKKLITLSYRTCLTCNLEFSTASTCFQHQSNMSHFQGGVALVTKYKCAECGQIFASSREGESHLLTHDEVPVKKKSLKSSKKIPSKLKEKTKSPSAKPPGQEIFKSLLVYCQYCKKGFLSQVSLDNHLRQGCEARPAVNSMMIVQPGLTEAFDLSLSPVAGLIQYNAPQIVQTVEAYGLSGVTQITPGVTNEIVVMTEQMAPEVVLDPLASTYMAALPDNNTNPGVVELSAVTGEVDPMVTSPAELTQPAIMRQEMGTQVDIDNVPLAELENDMKELAPDLMCSDPMIDSTDLMMDGEQKYSQEGAVQVETITYKNVSMLQHKMWLCSVCNMEFALKKDVFWHWERSACKEQGAKVTDAVNFQCIYCGEMFSEPTECRDHQLTSCLKEAGMQVQLLKNRHFHCRMCKGRYYERDHVEKHLGVYHRLSKKEAETKVREWFPDSYVRGIEEMLRSKKQGKQRYHHSDSQDGSKKSIATVQQLIDNSTKLESKIEPTQSSTRQGNNVVSNTNAGKCISVSVSCSEISRSVSIPAQVTITSSNKEPAVLTHPTFVIGQDCGQTDGVTASSVIVSGTSVGPIAATGSMDPAGLGSGQQCGGKFCSPPAGSTSVSDSKVQKLCMDVQVSEDEKDNRPLPLSNSTASFQLPSVPDVQNLETSHCGSPVPTCNISWSSSPGGASINASALRNTNQLLPPASTTPDKSGRKSKKGKRSSSTESQLSSISAKEKKSRGRSPVAPPEYHPCPKCGKVIEDRIALQIHLEFICGKSPTQISPARTPPKTPPKSSKKRRRQNSQGSSYSLSQDTSDSRSIVSDDGSMSSASRANTPSHAGIDSDTMQAKCQSEIAHWKCNFCVETFAESADLEKHVFAMHSQILNFATCPQCGAFYDGNKTPTCETCLQKSKNPMVQQESMISTNCHEQSASTGLSINCSQDHPQSIIISESQLIQDNLQLLSVTAISTQTALSLQPLDLPSSPIMKNDDLAMQKKPAVEDVAMKTVMRVLPQETPLIQHTITDVVKRDKQERREQILESEAMLTNQQTDVELKVDSDHGDLQGKSPGHKDSDTDSGCDEGPELDKVLQDGTDSLILPLMLSPNQTNVMFAENTPASSYSVTEDGAGVPGNRCDSSINSNMMIASDTSGVNDVLLKDSIALHVESTCLKPVSESVGRTCDAVSGAGHCLKDPIPSDASRNTGEISAHESDHHSATGDSIKNAVGDMDLQAASLGSEKPVFCSSNDLKSKAAMPEECLQFEKSESQKTTVAQAVAVIEVGLDKTKSAAAEEERIAETTTETESTEAPSYQYNDDVSSVMPKDQPLLEKDDVAAEDSPKRERQQPTISGRDSSHEKSVVSGNVLSDLSDDELDSVNIISKNHGSPETGNAVHESRSVSVREVQSVDCDSSAAVTVLSEQDDCPNSTDDDLEKKDMDDKPVRITRSMRQRMEYEAWMRERNGASQQENEQSMNINSDDLMGAEQVKDEESNDQTDNGTGIKEWGHSDWVSYKSVTRKESVVKLETDLSSSSKQTDKEHINKSKVQVQISKQIVQGSGSRTEMGSCEDSSCVEQEISSSLGTESRKARRSVKMVRQSLPKLTGKSSCTSPLSDTGESCYCPSQEVECSNTSSSSNTSIDVQRVMAKELMTDVKQSAANKISTDTGSTPTEFDENEDPHTGIHIKKRVGDENYSIKLPEENKSHEHMLKPVTGEALKSESVDIAIEGELTEIVSQDIMEGNSRSDPTDCNNTQEGNNCQSESTTCDKNKTSRPKPMLYVEESNLDFHSVVARAVKAWSKPSLDLKKNKTGSEKTKSLDLLLNRKKLMPSHIEKVTKCQQKSRPKHDGCEANGDERDGCVNETTDNIQAQLATSRTKDKQHQLNSIKSTDNNFQQSFTVKWKTFGKQPQEVSINIPLQMTETPTTKASDTNISVRGELQISKDCMSGNVAKMCEITCPNEKRELKSNLKCPVISENLELVTSTSGSRYQNDMDESLVRIASDQSKGECHSAQGMPTMELCADSPGRADFMEYHKELHDIVMVEGVDMFLSDEADLLLADSDSKSFLDLNLCSESLETSTLQSGDEIGYLQDGQYICPFCDDERSFRFEYNLTSHLKCVHGVVKEEPQETTDLWCPICKDLPAFDELLMLLYHMRAVHGIPNFDVGSKCTRSPAMSVGSQQSTKAAAVHEPCESTQQNARLTSPKELKFGSPRSDVEVYSDVESTCSDVSNVTGITSIESGISLQEDFISKHPELAAKVISTQRVCSSCNVAFLRMEHYKSHLLRYHTVEQKALQWRCGLCSKLFLQHDEWRKHLYEHFPSRKRARQSSSTLTATEKQVLREAASKECKRPAPVTMVKPAGTEHCTTQKASTEESGIKPSSKWDEVFGLDTSVDRLDKVARTYSRNSLNASKKSVQMLKYPSSLYTEETPSTKRGFSKPDQVKNSGELMEPLSVSIPNDEGRLKAETQNSRSDTYSSAHASKVSKPVASDSPDSITSSLSKSEKMSPVSVASNPEMSTRCLHLVGKRRHSCDGCDTQQMLETRSFSLKSVCAKDPEKGVMTASVKRELRSNNVASKDKENSSHSKGSTNQTSLKKSCAKLDLVPNTKSSTKLRNTSRNSRQSVDMKYSVQYLSKPPDLCWKLPWEHYLRNTLRKQVSSAKKSSQANSDDGQLLKSKAIEEKFARCDQSVSKRKMQMNRNLASKNGSATLLKASSGQYSLDRPSNTKILPRRRRFSLSSDSRRSSSFPKRRRTESHSLSPLAGSAERRLTEDVANSRRLSTRLNHTSEVKGMALHTRSAEQTVTSKSLRKCTTKNRK